jgi:hypothetical protein
MRLFRIIQPGKHTKTAVDFSETELEELNHEYTSLLVINSDFITRHKIQKSCRLLPRTHDTAPTQKRYYSSNWKFTNFQTY